jgi:hypothetical protein
VDFQGKLRALAADNRDEFAHFAHLLGVSTGDLLRILTEGGEMHENRRKSVEAVRTNARLRNKGSGGAWGRNGEGLTLGRIVRPADPERAAREARHKTMPHYRLRDHAGRFLRLDCEGLTADKGSAWIGTETQLRNVVKRFPLARGMRASKVAAAKMQIPAGA